MAIKHLNENEVIITDDAASKLMKSIFTPRDLIERYVTSEIQEAVKTYGNALEGYPFNK